MSQLHLKTYDQLQREAVLTTCSKCGKPWYCTHPRPSFICLDCTRAQGQERG